MNESYTSEEFYSLISGLIEETKLEMALRKLKTVLKGNNFKLKRICSVLISRLNDNKNKKMAGTISFDNYNVERNQITESTLEFLEKICESEEFLQIPSENILPYSVVIKSKQYFENTESHLLPETIPCYADFFRECQAYFVDEVKQIQLIHAPGGYGKSHFLRQISEEGESYFDEVLIFISTKTDVQEVLKDLQQRFERSENKTLLLLDDAERKLSVLPAILRFISQNKNVKLLLTSRSAGLESVEDIVSNIKNLPLKYQEPINFGEWKEEDLIRILRLAARESMVKNEEHIVKHIYNPYLLVELGKHIAGLSEYDVKAIRRNIAAGILSDCYMVLEGLITKEAIPSFLARLSLLSPIDKQEEEKVIEFLANEFELIVEKTALIYQKLVGIGILKEIGYSVRFNPDTKGDFFLADFLKDKTSDEILLFLKVHLAFNERKTIRNLEASLNYLPEGKSVLEALLIIINEWKEATLETDGLVRRQRVKAIKNLIIFEKVDSSVIDLVNEYIRYDNSDEVKDPDNYYARLNANPDLNEYAPLILHLIKQIDKRAECLDIIEKLHIKGEESYASNYKTVSLVAEACKFFHNTIESYQVCLDFIKKWLDSKDKHLLELVKNAVKPIICATNEYRSSEYNTMTFGERFVPNDEKYFSIREKVIGFLLQMLDDENTILIAIDLIEDIGTGGRLKQEVTEDLPMTSQFRKERSMVIPKLSTILFETKNFKIKKAIENLFFRWWLLNISDEVVPYLEKMERTPEYLVLQYAFNTQFIIKNFKEIFQKAPSGDKWKWYWSKNRELKRWDKGWEYYDKLTNQLSEKYDTPQKKVAYLESLNNAVNQYKSGGGNVNRHLFQIIISLVHGAIEQFETIKKNPKYWHQLSDDFQTVITEVLMQQGKLTLAEVGEEIIQILPDPPHFKLNSFLMLLRKESATDKEKWFYQLIQKGNQTVRSYIAADLNWQFPEQENAEKMVDILIAILEKEDPAETFFSNRFIGAGFTYEAIFEKKEFIAKDKYEKLRNISFDWIKKVSRLNYDVKNCVKFCIESTADLKTFIAYRIQNWTLGIGHHNETPYQVSDPFFEHGVALSWIEKLFIHPNEYRNFLNTFIEWRETYPIGIQNSFKDFLRLLKNVSNPETNQKFIIEYVEDCLQQAAIKKALTLSEYIPQNEENYPLTVKVWAKALETHSPEAIEKAVHRWNREGGFSTSWNGSREYADIAIFEKLLQLLNGTQITLKKIFEKEHSRAVQTLSAYEIRRKGEWLR